MKIGRNDPCPCGSGKKYKQCCFMAEVSAAEAPEQMTWRRLRRVLEGVPTNMLNFVLHTYGKTAFLEAWDEFTLWDEIPFEDRTPHAPVFFPWMYHLWVPDPNETAVVDASLHGVTPTQAYLQRKGKQLDPALRRYLEACLTTAFGFYEIVRCEPGQGFRAREVITAAETEVLERSASQSMQVGDILFGSLITCDGIVMLEACAPHVIPPMRKIEIIQLRQQITRGGDLFAVEPLREWQDEIRTLYFDLIEPVLNPVLPELRNTDGEALYLQRLVYDIDSAEQAFNALKHLALKYTEAELRDGADIDAHGRLSRVSFDWCKRGNRVNKGWDNTVLGTIEIKGRRLTAEVNSQQRAEQLKQIIETRLDQQARYRATEIRSMEHALTEASAKSQRHEDAEQNELMQRPEVQAKLREMLSQHYDDWVNQKIPTLGGKTPLQAIKNADGREMVAALLNQMERNDNTGLGDQAFILTRLRKRLGLVQPNS